MEWERNVESHELNQLERHFLAWFEQKKQTWYYSLRFHCSFETWCLQTFCLTCFSIFLCPSIAPSWDSSYPWSGSSRECVCGMPDGGAVPAELREGPGLGSLRTAHSGYTAGGTAQPGQQHGASAGLIGPPTLICCVRSRIASRTQGEEEMPGGYFSVIANVISVLSGLFTPVITSVSSDPLKSAQQRHISVYIWYKHASPVSACDQIEERVSGLMTT